MLELAIKHLQKTRLDDVIMEVRKRTLLCHYNFFSLITPQRSQQEVFYTPMPMSTSSYAFPLMMIGIEIKSLMLTLAKF